MSTQPAPPAPIMVVRGGSNDLDEVMRVMVSAFPPRFGEGWSKSQCEGILPLSGVSLVLARDPTGTTRGFALARTILDESELLLLAVEAGSQGLGIGGDLLRHFITDGATRGLATLHLEVRDGNPATAMYRKYGFEPVGRRSKYYRGPGGQRFDAITMARPPVLESSPQ